MLCLGILTGCDDLNNIEDIIGDDDNTPSIGDDDNTPSISDSDNTYLIRPQRINLTGVQGFVIVENNSNAPRTKAETNGDGIDDDTNTSPYFLYTIDKNGEIKLSVFYFEVITSEEESGNTTQTQIQKEISEALQVVPSLVTDLGKYILFSGCNYQINDSILSDEARIICETFVQENYSPHMVYMIRKSDGALFDLSDQPIFSYYAFFNDSHYEAFPYYENHYDYTYHSGVRWAYIPSYIYTTSAKGNLFVRGTSPTLISKITDNGDAIDVMQMTQQYMDSITGYIYRFGIDEEENIYVFNRVGLDEPEIEIFYSNGGFNVHKIEPTIPIIDRSNFEVIDIITEESGETFIYLTTACSTEDYSPGMWLMSAQLQNGTVKPIKEEFIQTGTNREFFHFDGRERHHYIGYYDSCHNWLLEFGDIRNDCKILSYNNKTHQWDMSDLSESLNQVLSKEYDIVLYGSRIYCAIIKDS